MVLLRHLLQHNQDRRIAVLVNEFGEVGIDGELLRDCQICDEDANGSSDNILELANGCLCCTVQEEFLPVMQELLKRRDLDCINCRLALGAWLKSRGIPMTRAGAISTR